MFWLGGMLLWCGYWGEVFWVKLKFEKKGDFWCVVVLVNVLGEMGKKIFFECWYCTECFRWNQKWKNLADVNVVMKKKKIKKYFFECWYCTECFGWNQKWKMKKPFRCECCGDWKKCVKKHLVSCVLSNMKIELKQIWRNPSRNRYYKLKENINFKFVKMNLKKVMF